MKITRFLAKLGLAGLCSGCATHYPRLTEPNTAYLNALNETAGQTPENTEKALRDVMELFADFSYANLKNKIRSVYSEELFFRDGFKELYGIDELENYMLESTEPLRVCTFTFSKPINSAPDFYLQWTMRLNLKRDKPDKVDEVIGMSHIRFNREGKVVFQQDYWDPTDALYRRIPVVNGMIGYVRNKL